MSGSGVLLGGEMANGVITILGLSCRGRSFNIQACHLFTETCREGNGGMIQTPQICSFSVTLCDMFTIMTSPFS